MKDNLGSDYFLLAHVDIANVHFHRKNELGIEFRNEIDAWNKMAFKFRNSRVSDLKFARSDLSPLRYSVRSKCED